MWIIETSLSYEGIRDLLIREQTLGVVSVELRMFIEERTPESFNEMCNIAGQYLKEHGKFFRHSWVSDKNRSGVMKSDDWIARVKTDYRTQPANVMAEVGKHD